MRCPNCEAAIEDGTALCPDCGAPLTAYAGNTTGLVDERTLAKIARERVVPPVVRVMVATDIVVAIFWPIALTLRAFAARTVLDPDATNYVGHAFSGLNAFLTAGVMLPLAAGLCLVAWGSATQRAWAWYVNVGLMGLVALHGLSSLGSAPLKGLLLLVVACTLGTLWLRGDARRWYGIT